MTSHFSSSPAAGRRSRPAGEDVSQPTKAIGDSTSGYAWIASDGSNSRVRALLSMCDPFCLVDPRAAQVRCTSRRRASRPRDSPSKWAGPWWTSDWRSTTCSTGASTTAPTGGWRPGPSPTGSRGARSPTCPRRASTPARRSATVTTSTRRGTASPSRGRSQQGRVQRSGIATTVLPGPASAPVVETVSEPGSNAVAVAVDAGRQPGTGRRLGGRGVPGHDPAPRAGHAAPQVEPEAHPQVGRRLAPASPVVAALDDWSQIGTLRCRAAREQVGPEGHHSHDVALPDERHLCRQGLEEWP